MAQPTAKKSKWMETEDDASSSEGVSGDAGRLVGVQDENYFSPAFMDVWPKILGYVTEPKDVMSVMNASTVFHDFLEKRRASALMPLVLPILQHQYPPALDPHDLFNCRLVSKQVKASVDEFLTKLDDGDRDEWIRTDSYKLLELEDTQAFIEGTQGFKGNPFLARYCEATLHDRDDLQLHNRMEILRNYGHELNGADLSFNFDLSRPRGLTVLKRVLSYLPNLKSLLLQFFHNIDPEEDDDEEWHNESAGCFQFPRLEKLRKLIVFHHGRYNPNHRHPGFFIQPILKAYGNQLTSLTCRSHIFVGDLWESLHFPNLLTLEVQFFRMEENVDAEELIQIYGNVAKFHFPKLKELYLAGPGMRLSAETFLLLNKCRESLQSLSLWNLEEGLQPTQLDSSNIYEFPKLTKLYLRSVDVGTAWIQVFSEMFPNLEEIMFQSTSIIVGSRNAVDPPAPDEKLERSYYTSFPKLKRFVWLA